MTAHMTPRVLRGALSVRAEVKPADTPAELVRQLGEQFEAYKASTEEKVKAAAKGAVDVLTTEKIGKIDAALSDTQARYDELIERVEAMAAGLEGNASLSDSDRLNREHVEKFSAWMRGNLSDDALKAFQRDKLRADVQIGDNESGGYTAPVEWDRTITDKLVQITPMRRFASAQSVTGQGFSRLFNIKGATSGWVGETDARAETDTPVLKPYTYSFGEIYANPAMTQRAIEDPELDLEAWLSGEVSEEFMLEEGTAFLTGNGTNKPKGLLMYDATAEAALDAALRHPLGPITEVNTGNANTITEDGLIDLIYDLPTERSDGAAFYMNKKTAATVRKLRDSEGRSLWQPPMSAGEPATILGQPHRELFGMPDVAANAIPIVYGNMERTYRIFDRRGVLLIRDPYTRKGYVHFYTSKRVGGGLWSPEWMRYHRVAVNP